VVHVLGAGQIDSFYNALNQLGFSDPVHATLVHMPMGLLVGAFIFVWLATFSISWKRLAVSAHHCIILAFLFLFPVICFGIADWRHFYAGAWITPIKMKMGLAAVLFTLSLAAVMLGFKGKENTKTTLALSTLSLVVVVLLGWYDARLVYGEKPQGMPVSEQAGSKIFDAHCNACHANRGNKIKPDKPLKNSPDLVNVNTFIAQIRHPEAPMPALPPAQISDQEAKELYDYIIKVIKRSGGSATSP
jgi:uncharacterized membrane protein